MNNLNERIGYIDKDLLSLSIIINTISGFMSLPDNKVKWQPTFKINEQDIKPTPGILYYSFSFNISDKLGSVNIILVNITDYSVLSNKFKGFITLDNIAFYSPTDSTINIGENNVGYIYVSYNQFKKYTNNITELKTKLTSYLYHELRHYYDNVIGLYDGNMKELLHITLIADEFDINRNTFIDNVKKNSRYNSLYKFIYISNPTELNGWYHSFTVNAENYVNTHKNITKNEFIKYIKTKEVYENNFEYFIYNYVFAYKSIDIYKKIINTLCEKDPVSLFYYISETLTNCQPSDKTLRILNDLFEKKYLSYFTTEHIDMKTFGLKLNDFVNDYYILYVYKKTSRRYIHIVKNMNKFISTLF